MAYSKNIDNYPPEFAELYRQALIDTTEINCESVSQAIALRHQLNAYRRAVELVKTPGWSDLRQITIKLKDNTVIMVNNSSLFDAMRKAAKMTKPEDISDDALDEYMKQMDKGEQNETDK